MEREPNIVGNLIRVWQKQAATLTTDGVPVDQEKPVTVRPNIINLSDNILLAHYQRERRYLTCLSARLLWDPTLHQGVHLTKSMSPIFRPS